jgi:glycosyl transferase family 2
VSLIRHLRFARFRKSRAAIKPDRAPVDEGALGDAIAQIAALSARLERAEALIGHVAGGLRFEQYRIEAALFCAEGLTSLREEFLQAKATAEYQAVFDNDNPLVSVCVTTMNRGDLLVERALASLRAQSYRNLQIVVVGDHCTDDTAERIAGLGDSRISFINLPKRGPYPRPGSDHWGTDRWRVAGTHPANRALALVEGQFVTHLDEDDTFEPQRIEILLQKIREARADLVFHPFWHQQPDGGWVEFGNGSFEHVQTGTGMIFYHRYLARVPWDVYAYRFAEPGDWNRLRKFKMMRARIEYVPLPLTRYYRIPARGAFVAEEGEQFLE